MKKILIFICSVLLSAHAYAATMLHDANGNTFSTDSLKGKWVIINYWADWCDICIKEIPELNKFYRHNAGKNVVIYGVNYDQLQGDDLRDAIKRSKIAFPSLLDDPRSVWSLRGNLDVLPTTFIIDPNGRMVKMIIGASTEQSLRQALNELRAKKP